jgi:hypothetical protein
MPMPDDIENFRKTESFGQLEIYNSATENLNRPTFSEIINQAGPALSNGRAN